MITLGKIFTIKKLILLLFYSLIFTTFSFADVGKDSNSGLTSTLDSLQNLISIESDITQRLELKLIFAEKLTFKSKHEAKVYLNELIKDAKENNSIYTVIKANSMLTTLLIKLNNYIEAKEIGLKTIALALTHGAKEELSDAYNNLGVIYSDLHEIDSALYYYEKAYYIDKQTKNADKLYSSLNNIGLMHYFKSNYIKALDYYLQSIQLLKETGDNSKLHLPYNNIGLCYFEMGSYPKALFYFFEALKISEQYSLDETTPNFLGNIGLVYEQLGNKEKALKYYTDALKFAEFKEDKKGISSALNNIGLLYLNQRKFEDASFFFTHSLEIAAELSDKIQTSAGLNNLGLVALYKKNYTMADSLLQSALLLSKNIGDNIGVIEANLNLGELQFQKSNFTKAEIYCKDAILISENLGILDRLKEAYKLMSKIKESQSDLKSGFYFLRKYTNLSDSLFNAENIFEANNREQEYELEKRLAEEEKAALLLEMQTLNELNKQIASRDFAYIAFGISLFFTLFLVYNIMLKRRTNKKLQESNNTKDLFFSILAHDLRGPIINIHHMLKLFTSDKDFRTDQMLLLAEQEAKRIQQLLDNLVYWGRGTGSDLKLNKSNVNISDTVKQAVELFSNEIEKKNIKIEFDVIEYTLSVDADMIASVIRNIFSNAVKFTPSGGKIEVRTRLTDAHYKIEISDNGVGISQENIAKIIELNKLTTTLGTDGEKGTGLGSYIANEFIKRHNGTLSIESELNKGTTVCITLPLA